MKIDPSILTHPKFVRLRRAVGTEALEHLIRIWGHCENARRGEFWKGADLNYVEIVAQWMGVPGFLGEALVSAGWIHVEGDSIRIHEWNQTNWRAVSAWTNGELGGRKPSKKKSVASRETGSRVRLLEPKPDADKVATGSEQKSQSEMIGNEMNNKPPTPNGHGSVAVPGDDPAGLAAFEVPSAEEVSEFVSTQQKPNMHTGAGPMPIDWAQRHRQRWEQEPEKTPRKWREVLSRWWAVDGAKRSFAGAKPSVWERTRSIEALRTAIAENPFNESGAAFIGNDFEQAQPDAWARGKAELGEMRRALRELEGGLAK